MINQFDGRYRFLSNFYPSPILYKPTGDIARTVEHAYQASKTLDFDERRCIIAARTPGDAKRAGRAVKLRPDWESIKLVVMRHYLELKFAERSELAMLLLETGNQYLVEGNTWNDVFWGVSKKDNHGQNWLGHLLMARRAELRGMD